MEFQRKRPFGAYQARQTGVILTNMSLMPYIQVGLQAWSKESMFEQVLIHQLCPNITAIFCGYFLASAIAEAKAKHVSKALALGALTLAILSVVLANWHTDLTQPYTNVLYFLTLSLGAFLRVKVFTKRPGIKTPAIWYTSVFVGIPCIGIALLASMFQIHDSVEQRQDSPDHQFTAFRVLRAGDPWRSYIGLRRNSPLAVLTPLEIVAAATDDGEKPDQPIQSFEWKGPRELSISFIATADVSQSQRRWREITILYPHHTPMSSRL
jgi:hypothetical protein